ncbi:hypothetical protein LSH36_478g00007 [Paralvinella palmiformis]|uniref:Uncharacterized protein n=1 Tax=Paralvinella palmiformis TaxID=53620 RepID=A0AAD9JAT5_9ANNE|nr:hypothetical protein LSH36_478g00007 [Paralvinella palmiformis]
MASQISHLLESVHASRQHLTQLWHVQKSKLEQCLQLCMFEQDVEKMSDWISHNRQLFLKDYTRVGQTHEAVIQLKGEHAKFAENCMKVYTNITEILNLAQRLCDAGHYAAPSIRVQASKLDRDWRTLVNALEDRSTVLTLSVIFHEKAEQYLREVPVWEKTCEELHVPDDIPSLEDKIQQHQTLLETINQSYTETPVSSGSSNSITAKADYTEGASHVLDVVHDVFAHHRHVEQLWHKGKVKLHQRLGLRLFQQDVKQVIEWVDNHGDVFLEKNRSIGKSLQKATALRNNHEHFESVLVQVAAPELVAGRRESGLVSRSHN